MEISILLHFVTSVSLPVRLGINTITGNKPHSDNGHSCVVPTAPGTDIQVKPITSAFIDNIFQDTWILALAIKNIPGVVVDKALYQHCVKMVERVQEKLYSAGASDILADEIKFAHCVFLDEAVMTQPDTDVSVWWAETPLQGIFMADLHGGEVFYENIKKLLRGSSPH